MVVPFSDLLADADRRGVAIGAFTAYNLEGALAVLRAAEERGEGVILLVSSQAFRARGGPALVGALRLLAERCLPACCIQLDHAGDLDLMEAALEAGAGAVMADGSKLAYADNLSLVSDAARIAQRFGAGVEAELGHVAGDEELATAAERGALTDPAEAAEFVERTGAACLAVSIGNAHGRYTGPPELDWPRLEAIRREVSLPLSLHGASGVPDPVLERSVRAGIRKVNVNTELRERWFEVLAERAEALRPGAELLTLNEELIDALAEVAAAKLMLFAGREGENAPSTARP
jgi:tagatose 1,6-diphosphate aldolase GatY/KbaY